MKVKYVVCLLFLTISVSAQTSISKGSYSLGGSISYWERSYVKHDLTNDTYFEFKPNFGYFFIDNLYISISIKYMNESSYRDRRELFGFGPEVRYYYKYGKIAPFIGTSYLFIDDDRKYEWGGSNQIHEISFLGGVDIFISNSFAIELNANYSIIKEEYKYPPFVSIEESVFENSTRIAIGLGVNYFIN